MKVATSLFDLAPGVELPSDADLRAIDDAKKRDVVKVAILDDIDVLFFRLKPLDCEAKLEIARRFAKVLNGTTRMFNVAVFVRDKEEQPSDDLFAEPVSDVEPVGLM